MYWQPSGVWEVDHFSRHPAQRTLHDTSGDKNAVCSWICNQASSRGRQGEAERLRWRQHGNGVCGRQATTVSGVHQSQPVQGHLICPDLTVQDAHVLEREEEAQALALPGHGGAVPRDGRLCRHLLFWQRPLVRGDWTCKPGFSKAESSKARPMGGMTGIEH